MRHQPGALELGALAVVLLCWIVFAVVFLFRRKPKSGPAVRKDPRSFTGIVLQGVGFAIVWGMQRPIGSPWIPGATGVLAALLAIVTAGLSVGSLWMSLAAVRTLDRQWSYGARLIEGHKLITSGPYAIVRHPIYAAMFGKLVATNLALGHWLGLAPAAVLFLIGTRIRTGSEEALLREAFGPEYEAYAQRVPALLPRPF